MSGPRGIVHAGKWWPDTEPPPDTVVIRWPCGIETIVAIEANDQ